ncbi:cation-translocating P-type ATPase [Rubellimicrobium roseum]|uniref:cation-translocating P-type ATPase n=1 Tax=Rubellimicrobium roseum TaxID=687525 RepID=UPI001C3F4992|nr:cation-translocating P-type ATPase [Rubellimicrobium roseum]
MNDVSLHRDPAARGPWHTLEADEALAAQGSDGVKGLSSARATDRLRQAGPNEVQDGGERTVWHILWEQVSSVLILILVFAGGLAAVLGKQVDAIAIAAIVLLFVVLGVAQEYRAQRAVAALKQMSSPQVRVVRDGRAQDVSSRELVPGDLVILEAGNVVPADCRVIESLSLRVQEAALTGESETVEKTEAALIRSNLTVGDRLNMVFLGTAVTFGRGRALVVETGMRTELGRIASMIRSVRHEPTPLQRRLDRLGKVLAVVAVAIAAVVAIAGWMRGEDVSLVLLTGVSLAVAIVPEGLPAVLTFTLARGGQRMLRRKALIRKLPAVETLGSVTVICSDKTGTLTQNRITATQLATASGWHDLRGRVEGDEPDLLLMGAALCNDADLRDGKAVGDPTEAALLVAAAGHRLEKARLEKILPREAEIAFDSTRKRMTTVHRVEPGGRVFLGLDVDALFLTVTKGAADALLPLCSGVLQGNRIVAMDDAARQRMIDANDGFGLQGMRVLALAIRPLDALPERLMPEALERDLVLVGLVAMIDPPRAEAAEAVAVCARAGIRPVMITGDHHLTARKIAADLGICREGDRVVTGIEIERMSPAELEAIVDEVAVFARVSPEHKLRIVEALQRRGHVVAMTGDGVNDAPALKRADIGVAMGSGTDVAKEAADMVLLDDNFATIVAAVEEGRVVYDNVRRFIQFSVAGNIGKVLTVAVPPFLGLPLLLAPVQILFSNLLTDGLLGLGLGTEKAEKGNMERPPYRPQEGVFSRGVGLHVAWLGALIGAITIGAGWWAWSLAMADGLLTPVETLYISTLVFSTLAILQIGRVLAARSFRQSAFALGPFGNPTLLAMIAVALVAQLVVVYWPGAQPFFHTTDIGLTGLLIGVAAAVTVLLATEVEKGLRRRAEDDPAQEPGTGRLASQRPAARLQDT